MVYFGEFRSKLDKEGRIVIPSKMREQLKDRNVYITRGFEECLFLFSETIWNSQTEKLKTLPFTKGDPRAFTRLFFSGAYRTKIDKQGRLNIPLTLTNYAKINNGVVIIGVGFRIEIWDEKKWDEYYKKFLPSYAEISEKLIGSE
ncbi:MAG TPA: division/cell wall cluster transcriptional repressor MraZ [bacterium]|nr:division/cell wall cluster transcriptional repressor MraZ [bacterium]